MWQLKNIENIHFLPISRVQAFGPDIEFVSAVLVVPF